MTMLIVRFHLPTHRHEPAPSMLARWLQYSIVKPPLVLNVPLAKPDRKSQEAELRVGEGDLDADSRLAPMSPLGVVSVEIIILAQIQRFRSPFQRTPLLPLQRRRKPMITVPDRVAGPKANPLRNGPVLLLGFG